MGKTQAARSPLHQTSKRKKMLKSLPHQFHLSRIQGRGKTTELLKKRSSSLLSPKSSKKRKKALKESQWMKSQHNRSRRRRWRREPNQSRRIIPSQKNRRTKATTHQRKRASLSRLLLVVTSLVPSKCHRRAAVASQKIELRVTESVSAGRCPSTGPATATVSSPL